MLILVVTNEQYSIPFHSMTSVLYIRRRKHTAATATAAETLSDKTDVKVLVQSILYTIIAMTTATSAADIAATPAPAAPAAAAPTPAPLKTEDTGKIFEKAICDSFCIPYDGPFKYSQDEVDKLVPRLSKLVTDKLFPPCVHTASKGARYDFTSIDGASHLSAKSNKKKGGQLAPQVVGQPHPQKFCQVLGIEYTTPETLKQYIQENIVSILPVLWNHTFDSQIIYYVKETDSIRFITPTSTDATSTPAVNWSEYQYTWTCPHDKWNNTSSLKLEINGKKERILEFQFHTKNRQNMAIRWSIETVLRVFNKQFTVVSL